MLTFGLFPLFEIFFMTSLMKYRLIFKINTLIYRMTISVGIHLLKKWNDNSHLYSDTFDRKNSAKQIMSGTMCALNCKVHVIIPFNGWLQNCRECSASKIIDSGIILLASTKSHASGSLPLAC